MGRDSYRQSLARAILRGGAGERARAAGGALLAPGVFTSKRHNILRIQRLERSQEMKFRSIALIALLMTGFHPESSAGISKRGRHER
jgi:hypothetical protein